MRMEKLKYKKHIYRKKNTVYNLLKRVLRLLFSNLPQLSLLSAAIGFINIWIYLSRIDKLNLLTSFLASPATLLAIFASMMLIIILSMLLLLMPTFIFSWISLFDSNCNSRSIIVHSVVISIILSIIGTTDTTYVTGFLIFIIAFYLCYFNWERLQHRCKTSFIAFLKGLFINISTLIIMSAIYNNAALSGVARFYKIIILLSYLIIIYIPLIACNDILINKKKTKKNNPIQIIAITILMAMYFIGTITPGLLTKLNNYTLAFTGLRSDTMTWYKVNTKNFPSGWLDRNWNIKPGVQDDVWIQAYPIIQNNNIAFICSEQTYKQMNEYVNTRLNAFVEKQSGSMDTSHCILIQNNMDVSVKVTDHKSNQ